jgi:endonuclease YncB( thermonuclease family)
MIRKGYAEAYIEYLKEPYRSQFMAAQRESRSAKREIWSLPDYERSKDFKKRLKVRGY